MATETSREPGERRRQMDDYLMKMLDEYRANLQENINELRLEIRGFRAEIKEEVKEISDEFDEKYEQLRRDEAKHAAVGTRMQVYVLIIAFLLAQAAVHMFDKLFG